MVVGQAERRQDPAPLVRQGHGLGAEAHSVEVPRQPGERVRQLERGSGRRRLAPRRQRPAVEADRFGKALAADPVGPLLQDVRAQPRGGEGMPRRIRSASSGTGRGQRAQAPVSGRREHER
jgi:hypothetical protein